MVEKTFIQLLIDKRDRSLPNPTVFPSKFKSAENAKNFAYFFSEDLAGDCTIKL